MAKANTTKKTAATKKAEFLKGVNAPFNQERLAKDIYAKREKENASFRDIQKLTGVSAATVYNAEAKIGTLNPFALASLCNWLKVPVQTYFKA